MIEVDQYNTNIEKDKFQASFKGNLYLINFGSKKSFCYVVVSTNWEPRKFKNEGDLK